MSVAENILELLDNCIFPEELTSENFEYCIINNLPSDFDFDYASGVSKCVIIPKGAQYVIKIPFTAYEDYKEEYDPETDEYYDTEYFNSPFEEAPIGNGWDYCAVEQKIWKLAKEEKVEKAFCKTKFIGCVCGHPIYIQERARIFYFDDDNNDKPNSKYNKDNAEKFCSNKKLYAPINNAWLRDALNYYGEKQFTKIMNFIKKYQLRDFHSDNIGYIGTRPVIVDYSGWNE